MTDDAYWDELGVAWRAEIPDPGLAALRLEGRLRRQGALALTGTMIGVLGGVAALGLGGWTAWAGASHHAWSFVTRGTSIIVVGVLMLIAARSLGGGGLVADGSLRQMLALSMRRSERQATAAGLGCLAVLILVGGGLVGYVVRAHTGRPAALSPVEPLLALSLLGLVLLWIRLGQSRTARACRRLTLALALDEAP